MGTGLAAIAALATGLFAGAALYVSLVEHPVRRGLGAPAAVRQFRPSYRRAAVLQVILAVVGSGAALARAATGGHAGWIVGGLLLAAVIPYTLMVVMPTNARLLDGSLDPENVDVPVLLERWGRLHAVRTAAGLAALIIFLALLPAG